MAVAEVIAFPFEDEARRGRRTFDDGVTRWAATDIARWAGAAAPEKVKQVIDDHHEEFARLGGLEALPLNPGPRGGRPGEEYWLDFEQSLLLCVFLRSPRAADVRNVLVRITGEVARCALPVVNDAHGVMLSLLEIHKQNAALLQKMDERQDRMDARQERVEADMAVLRNQNSVIYMTAMEALELARKTADRLPERRRGATLSTAAICREANFRMFDGRCPRCRCRIIERTKDGSLRCLPNADLHHQHGRSRNHPTQMCYVCHECNQALEDPGQQAQFGPTFQAIVIVVNVLLNRSQQLGLFVEGEIVA